MGYIRQDEADIWLTVDGVNYGNGESWFSYTGATLSAAGAKTRAGGMGKEIELGGPATRSDATITTQNSDVMVGQHRALEAKIGKGNALIKIQYLDEYGNALPGASFTLRGKLKEADLPDANANTADAGMYTVIVACHELAA
jgi:hypothetical protein